MRTKESPKIRKMRSELASGDYKTKQGPRVHITEVASGDYVTKKGQTVHISEVASGDYVTKKGVTPHVAEKVSGDHVTKKGANPHVAENLSKRIELAEKELPTRLKMSGGATVGAIYDGPSSESGNSLAHKDQAFIQQHNKVVSRCMVSITARKFIDSMHSTEMGQNGVMITGRTMMINHHFWRELDPKEGEFNIILPLRQNNGTTIRVRDCKFVQMRAKDGAELDIVLVSLPNVLPSFPSIINMFSKPNEIDNIQEGLCYLTGLEQYKTTGKNKEVRMMVRDMYLPDIQLVEREVEYLSDDVYKTYKLSGSLQYTAPTQPGHCGFLVFAHSTPMKGRICGIHVAGSKQTGMAIALTDALIKRHVEELEKIEPDKRKFVQGSFSTQLKSEIMHVDPFLSMAELNVDGDYMHIGIAEKVPTPVKTALSKSPIHGKIYPTRTKPAHLKPVKQEDGTWVCPLRKGIAKSFTIQQNVDLDILKAASNDVFRMFEKDNTDITRLLTYEEAITGVDGVEYAASMNRTTSAGFPFVLSKDNFGKRKWLGHTEEWDTSNEELRARVENIIENAKQNKRTEVVFMSTLKDERRPFAKVDQIKTRVFEAGPMDYSIAIRKYFMGFVESVMRKRIRNEVCVGINAYSTDWHRLATHLQRKGSHVIAGDFSNFDGSLLQIILWEIVDIINRWYDDSEENQLVRQVLFEEIVNTFVLVDGVIIQKTHSQPSGNPLTVIVNSLFNQIVMRMAYLILKKEQKLGILCDFTDNVAMATYGDDNVLNISQRVIKWYNQVEITRALATFGLTYTDEAKTGQCVPYRKLEDVNFLKRSFVKNEDGIYVAPLDIEVVRDMTNWIRGTKPRDSLLENVNSALLEFGLHGKSVYEKEVQLLRNACANIRIKPRFPTYAEMDSIYATHRAQ